MNESHVSNSGFYDPSFSILQHPSASYKEKDSGVTGVQNFNSAVKALGSVLYSKNRAAGLFREL
jgi:hypothetical protein